MFSEIVNSVVMTSTETRNSIVNVHSFLKKDFKALVQLPEKELIRELMCGGIINETIKCADCNLTLTSVLF